MTRRAGYMYGAALPRGARRARSAPASGRPPRPARSSLIAPTVDITRTGQEETRRRRADRLPDDAGHRGAVGDELPLPRPPRPVHGRERHPQPAQRAHPARRAGPRRPRVGRATSTRRSSCSRDDSDVVFASHHWPTWGTDRVVDATSSQQRDLYAYLHDQTLRLMNRGLTGAEIAEVLELPPALEAAWHTRGYYGSVSHNVKAVYQRYIGWFDGNPAHLWRHPPRGRGTSLRRVHGRHRRRPRAGPRVVRRRRLPVGRRGAQPRGLRRPRPRRGPERCWPAPSSSSATAPRTAPGATSTSSGAPELRERRLRHAGAAPTPPTSSRR